MHLSAHMYFRVAIYVCIFAIFSPVTLYTAMYIKARQNHAVQIVESHDLANLKPNNN